MTFISRKIIKGKARYYLERSVRLPDGGVKKYSIYLKGHHPSQSKKGLQAYEEKLQKRIRHDLIVRAVSRYKKNAVFNEATLAALEDMRFGYKEIIKKLTKKQLQDVIDRFAVNFSYESNAIEGNSLTLKDVALLFHERAIAKNKDLREIYEALNTRKALQLIFRNALHILELDTLKLHKILVANTGVALGYKQLPNFILGKSLKTISPEKVEQEMRLLLAHYEKNSDLHPLQRAADFHGMFEKIHPFEDGNGRAGRLLINIILLTYGYPPLIIRKTQRVAYFSALSAFDYGYPDKLYRFLIDRYKQTYRQFFQVYVKYLK